MKSKSVRSVIKDVVIIAVEVALLVAYSVDILYLYFAHGWREPILPILWAELITLGLTPLFAAYLLVRFCRHYGRC